MSLKYLFDYPRLNARKDRWMEFLCEFDFESNHVKGKENKVAYTFSRKFHVATLCICKSYLRTRVLEAQNNDETYLQVEEKLQQGKVHEKCEGYHLGEGDLLVYKVRMYILNCAYLKKLVMDEIHQMPYSGNLEY